MSKSLAKFNRATKCITAIALMLWLGGVTCVFGCEMMSAENVAHETQTRSMFADRPCHKRAKSKKEVSPARNLPTRSTISCCPFIQQVIQTGNANAETQPALVETNGTRLIESKERVQSNFIYRARLPDRGGTHLQNCVFLI